jgi:hypothetical protein
MMFYSMETTMSILPQICLMVLGICLMLTEFREEGLLTSSDFNTDPGGKKYGLFHRNDFILPPGEGFGCSVGESRFYIVRRDDDLFRVYIARGRAPSGAVGRDRFGRFFTIRCNGIRDAMRIVRNIYIRMQ